MHNSGAPRREKADLHSASLRGANGSRECAPDDRLRDEAIHSFLRGEMDCFAPLAMTVLGTSGCLKFESENAAVAHAATVATTCASNCSRFDCER